MEKTGNYELLYIVHPDLEGSLDKVVGKVKGFINERGGKITYEEDWGKKKLAYEINKTDVGIYILWYFEMPKEKVQEVEKDLKITEEVMRFMILKIEDKPKKETKKAKKVKKAEEEDKKSEKPKAKAVKGNEDSEKSKKESEKERMEKLDEKLGELLEGEESDTKSAEKKEKGGKK